MDQTLLAAAAAASSSNLNVDSLIQSALAAGVPPLQVVQFVQQRQALQQQQQQQQQNALTSAANNALQQHQHLSASQTPGGSVGSSATPSAAQPHAATLSGFSLANAAAVLAAQHQQHPQSATQSHQHSMQMASLLHQAQQAQAQAHAHQNQQQQQSGNTGTTASTNESNSLPWPIFQPTVNVPYFDMNTYQKVNLDVQASALPSGMDLPLHDMNTLRFFFNFGVHHARAILLREHFHIATPNGQQQPGSQAQTQLGQGQQNQNQVSNALLALQQQDPALYQQALLKANPEALASVNTQKPMGGPLPGTTSAATDPNTVFQLQRDLSTSISINQLQNTLAQMNNKMGGQTNASIGQQGMANNLKNEQIEALLLQNSMLGQSNPAMQFRIANSAANALAGQNQQQAQHHEGLHRPTAILPSSIPLALAGGAGKPAQVTSVAAQHAQNQQQQLLGGLGISAHQQVPLDPAPRAMTGIKPNDVQLISSTPNSVVKPAPTSSVANPVPLTSSVLASFLQEQQAHDRMKPTSLVRGAISDVARPTPTIPTSSASPSSTQITAASNANVPPTTTQGQTTTSNSIAAQFSNGQISLAAQLSVAMMQNAFLQQNKNGANGTATNATPHSESAATTVEKPVASFANNPDAHLLAGTSPFVKLMTSPVSRSLTAGTGHPQQPTEATTSITSNATTTTTQGQTSTANSASHPYLLGPFGGADLDPTTFLATTELNYTEAFRRSHDQRESATTPDGQRRKSGIYMLPGNGNENANKDDPANKKKASTEKPIGPTMINYVNSCLNQLKSQVQSHGVALPVDSNFRPIDYSSRPIDAIFRKAREQLDRDRDYTQHRASVSPALLQKLHANAQLGAGGQADESGSATHQDDGTSSAPASTATLNTVIGISSKPNETRSQSEQPMDTAAAGNKRSSEDSKSDSSVVNGVDDEITIVDDGEDESPEKKRQKVDEETLQKTETTTPSS